MSSHSFHDVQQIEVEAPKFANGHSWTVMTITHRESGHNEDGEYAEIVTKTTFALHHKHNFHGILPLVMKGS